MGRIWCLIFFSWLSSFPVQAQREPDRTYRPSIRTVKLHPFGDPLAYPVITLNGSEQLELNFDDLDADVKTYYYSFELCNADWTPAQMNYFDYVKGYSRVRISTYRTSAVALTRYTHYNAVFPDRNAYPSRSGNYMLRVFLNGDTSQVAFTRRFLVREDRIQAAVQVLQPYGQQYFQTHHRLQVNVSARGLDMRYPQQQVRVVVLQNYRWDSRLQLSNPTFIRQDQLQYANESEMLMPAGKEWRWLNLRSFRLLGDRVSTQRNTDSSYSVFVQEDQPRLAQQYYFIRDQNGLFVNETTERINPYWEADYATVHFRFRPPGGQPYRGKDLFVFGEISGYGLADGARMKFDPSSGVYETSLLLKQGYYDYQFATRDSRATTGAFSTELPENNSWETENLYLVLVYYRELGGRYDQLLHVGQVSSRFRTQGF